MKIAARLRLTGLLLGLILGLMLVSAAVSQALPSEDLNLFRRLVRIVSTANPANGSSYGGLQVGTDANPGTKITKSYSCLLKAVAPPSLATTCTTDTFTASGNQGQFTYVDPSTGVAAAGAPACAPLFNAIAKGDTCLLTSGTNATTAYQQACIVPAANQVLIKTCTFGTLQPASQDLKVTVLSNQ